MSICGGIAGRRGKNPVGIFIHNGADSQNATAAYYRNYLQNANLENGFAHYYVCSDGILQAEDDENCAWHCGYLNGNLNFLSIEVCQSMGDLDTFKANEEKALQLAAQKCKQYGIVPTKAQSCCIRRCMQQPVRTDQWRFTVVLRQRKPILLTVSRSL